MVQNWLRPLFSCRQIPSMSMMVRSESYRDNFSTLYSDGERAEESEVVGEWYRYGRRREEVTRAMGEMYN